MASKALIKLILCACLPILLFAQQPGSWQDHLPYHQVTALSNSTDKIFCATPYALFTVNISDNSIERISKINGLSEVGIAQMKTEEQTGKTIIAYTDGNIDLLTISGTINLDQVKRSSFALKNVNDIFISHGKAWLSAAFGIVVIDLFKNEIRETYIIGQDGKRVEVYEVTTDNKYIYAATGEGLKRAGLLDVNLSDFRNWEAINGNWASGAIQQVLSISDNIIARKSDSLFIRENDVWRFFYATPFSIERVSVSSGKLLISENNVTGDGRIVALEADGLVNRIYEQPGVITSPMEALLKGNDLWIADTVSGLLQVTGSQIKSYQPNSPYRVSTGDMIYADNSLWVTSGTGTSTTPRQNSFSRNGFYQYSNMDWKNYLPSNLQLMDSMYDLLTVAFNHQDRSVWLGSQGGGLLRYKAGETPQLFREQSGIAVSLIHPGQYRVTGLAFDDQGHLWISNDGAAENIVVRKSDGSWRRFRPPFSMHANAVAGILVDASRQKWIISPEGNGLIVFNHGQSIDNTGDDYWKLFRSGKGNGNLPDNNVLSIAEDKSGFIWVGTAKGIGIIQCASQLFSPGTCEAVLPVVQQDNFAGYLFSNEAVQDIAVNAADQKWIATRNGAWLISADGLKTLLHFTEENSPLFSNDVRKIEIDPKTGDVFFATLKGICAFRGNAIEGASENSSVKIYPNPVPPGYNGSIAIRGLVNNAIVKITELDGRMVFQTRALGGQAIWNGMDYRGRQVSSGVYLVLVSDDSRQEKTAGKIVFINR